MRAECGIGDLLRTLPVDVEKHVASGLDRGLYGRAGRAVEIAEDMGVLKHALVRHLRLEFGLVQKMVILAVDFSGPRCACRGRDRELDLRVPGA